MKKNKLLYKLLYVLVASVLIPSCDNDDEGGGGYSISFGRIASSYHEEDGTGTVTIPLVGSGKITASDLSFGGTATEGEDFEVVGITAEGLQISVIDDDDYEVKETLRIELASPNAGGNKIHTITIVSDCQDTNGMDASFFEGEYSALEDYGSSTYGPYDIEFVQDDVDPNKFHFDNFYDSGCDAYVIVNLAAGTVYFPNQSPCSSALTNSSGTLTLCDDETFTINLDYDGGPWVYRFTKH